MESNKLILKHSKDNFLLKLDDTEVNCITAYEIKSNAMDRMIDLTIKMSIDFDSIDIEIDKDVNLH